MLVHIHMTWKTLRLKIPGFIYFQYMKKKIESPFCVPYNTVLQVWNVIKVAAPLTLATNLWLSHTPVGCTEQSAKRAQASHPEIRITHHISEGSLLSPVVEQEGEIYLERVGNLRRHSVTNAHSDIKLLTVTSRVYTGMDDSCETIDLTKKHLWNLSCYESICENLECERKTETMWHSIIYKDK